MEKGILYGVSVGPGDPELLTLKAVHTIEQADVIAVPNTGQENQRAYQAAESYLAGKQILDCSTPMKRDHGAALGNYQRIANDICALLEEGKTVAYLVLGDAGIYSTYTYVHALVRERGYATEIVPGVPSFCAAAARLQKPLCEGSQQLLVVPAITGDWEKAFDVHANKVFMKTGRNIALLKEALLEQGLLSGAGLVIDCGLPEEEVYDCVADAGNNPGYFSVVLVKDNWDEY